MTQHQLSDDHVIAWIHAQVDDEEAQFERSQTVVEKMELFSTTSMDVLNALRTSYAVVDRYEVHCYVVRGRDLDGEVMHVVVAPPSAKNRLRVVNIWF